MLHHSFTEETFPNTNISVPCALLPALTLGCPFPSSPQQTCFINFIQQPKRSRSGQKPFGFMNFCLSVHCYPPSCCCGDALGAAPPHLLLCPGSSACTKLTKHTPRQKNPTIFHFTAAPSLWQAPSRSISGMGKLRHTPCPWTLWGSGCQCNSGRGELSWLGRIAPTARISKPGCHPPCDPPSVPSLCCSSSQGSGRPRELVLLCNKQQTQLRAGLALPPGRARPGITYLSSGKARKTLRHLLPWQPVRTIPSAGIKSQPARAG